MLIYAQKPVILYELNFLLAGPPLKIDVLHIHHYPLKKGIWRLDLRSECLTADGLEVSTMLHKKARINYEA